MLRNYWENEATRDRAPVPETRGPGVIHVAKLTRPWPSVNKEIFYFLYVNNVSLILQGFTFYFIGSTS